MSVVDQQKLGLLLTAGAGEDEVPVTEPATASTAKPETATRKPESGCRSLLLLLRFFLLISSFASASKWNDCIAIVVIVYSSCNHSSKLV